MVTAAAHHEVSSTGGDRWGAAAEGASGPATGSSNKTAAHLAARLLDDADGEEAQPRRDLQRHADGCVAADLLAAARAVGAEVERENRRQWQMRGSHPTIARAGMLPWRQTQRPCPQHWLDSCGWEASGRVMRLTELIHGQAADVTNIQLP